MRFETALDVMKVAEQRGLTVMLNDGPPPQPYVRGMKEHATPALMAALTAFRLEIIEELRKRRWNTDE